MSPYKDKAFSDRLSEAANARKTALEVFRARTAIDDPAAIERQAARLALGTARETRLAARKAEREAEAARLAIEMAARNEALAKQSAALEIERAARALVLEAEQKANRDARYAARKARQGGPGKARGR